MCSNLIRPTLVAFAWCIFQSGQKNIYWYECRRFFFNNQNQKKIKTGRTTFWSWVFVPPPPPPAHAFLSFCVSVNKRITYSSGEWGVSLDYSPGGGGGGSILWILSRNVGAMRDQNSIFHSGLRKITAQQGSALRFWCKTIPPFPFYWGTCLIMPLGDGVRMETNGVNQPYRYLIHSIYWSGLGRLRRVTQGVHLP